jgi:hypothetical protein
MGGIMPKIIYIVNTCDAFKSYSSCRFYAVTKSKTTLHKIIKEMLKKDLIEQTSNISPNTINELNNSFNYLYIQQEELR